MISVATSTTTTHESQQPQPVVLPPAPESTTTSSSSSSSKPEIIFRSPLPDIKIDNHLTLHDYCFARAVELADKPCLICSSTGRIYSYAETHLTCKKTASGFASKLGVKSGDVVFLLLPNSPEFIFCFFGASMLGAATSAANPFYTPPEILKQFKHSGSKVVVTLSTYVDKFRTEGFPAINSDELKIVTVDSPPTEDCISFADLISSEDEELPLPVAQIVPTSPVSIPFSSGTTGLPKGVVLTHKSLISSIAQQVDGENPNLHLTEEDVFLCVLPMFHIFSLNSVMLCALRAGSAVLVMSKFEIGAMLQSVVKYKVTIAAVVPPIVLALAKYADIEKYDLSSIKKVLCGAAPLGKELQETLYRRLPQAVVGQGYGMTEAGPVIAMCPAFAKNPTPVKPGSCGNVIRNAEMKLVDPESGLSVGRNQQGEICICGPQIMQGYLNNPEATANTIDADGWLHTGDIGYVDDDDEIFIVDRVKEIIKYKGFQVAPAEIEALLINHPSIADAAVVHQKDVAAGEIPVAFVVPSQGSELTEEAVKDFVAKQVVFYKKVHRVYFVDSIPKSAAGKILRKDLRARLA